MKLFLVRGEVISRGYMEDKDKRIEDMRLVYADTEDEARLKWDNFWEGKTQDYSCYYRTAWSIATETLE